MVSLGRKITLWEQDERMSALYAARPILRTAHFDVKIAPKKDAVARLLVVTSKKVGSAPYRNLLKRRARSIFYQEQLFNSASDWVIFFRPQQTELSYERLHEALINLYKKHG